MTLDKRRQAFLDDIEADLTNTEPGHPAEVGSLPATAGCSSRTRRRLGAVGLALGASAAFLALSTGAAQAGTDAPTRLASNCFTPNLTNQNHVKYCGSGASVHFRFLTSYGHGPGGQGTCYVFERTYFGCGGGSSIPDTTVCD